MQIKKLGMLAAFSLFAGMVAAVPDASAQSCSGSNWQSQNPNGHMNRSARQHRRSNAGQQAAFNGGMQFSGNYPPVAPYYDSSNISAYGDHYYDTDVDQYSQPSYGNGSLLAPLTALLNGSLPSANSLSTNPYYADPNFVDPNYVDPYQSYSNSPLLPSLNNSSTAGSLVNSLLGLF